MRYAIIENNKIINIISATAEFAQSIGAIRCEGSFSIGDMFINGEFIKGDQPKSFVVVKPMYMRLALDHFNLLDAIEQALELPQNKVKKIAFEYALAFERDDEMINGFAQAFGLSESSVDEIFMYAQSIQQ